MKKILFFEDDYQFDVVETNLNVHEDFIQMKLAKQYEYRPTDQRLWAIWEEDGQPERRFELDYNNCKLIEL